MRDFVAIRDKIYLDEDAHEILKIKDIIVDDLYLISRKYGLSVDGKVYFFSPGEDVPDGTVFRCVKIIAITTLTYWKWDVLGDFDASCSSLNTIAKHVKFYGDVWIGHTSIKHWCHNVGGNFRANYSELETIAENVSFGGCVYIEGTKIKHWHNDVGGHLATCLGLETISETAKIKGRVYAGPSVIRHDLQ